MPLKYVSGLITVFNTTYQCNESALTKFNLETAIFRP